MGHRRAPLALAATVAIATSFVACQTPTSMTVAVSTDVLCQALEEKSDAAIIVGKTAEDLLDLENVASTKTCAEEGPIGEVVLLPQGDEATEVAFKIMLGVGRPTADCGLVDTGEPEGVWAGCIVARRRLAFLDGEALVVEVPLYERCIGVPCGDGEEGSPFTTCNSKGECVPADLDPEDCLGAGCGDEQLQGTVTNAATTTGAAGGDGGASSTSDAATTTSTGEGGSGGGGGAPGCAEGERCLLEDEGEGVCDADGACVACVADGDCVLSPSQAVCADAECVAATCGVSLLAPSTPCNGEPGVCDGAGTCVECVVASDCPAFADECQGGFCQPLSCSDDAKNGDETDLDCGGDDCAPCPDGRSCGDAGNPASPENESCLSGYCQPPPGGQGGPVCARCTNDAQCDVDRFCDVDTGTCEPPRGDGDPCLGDSWCSSGTCVQDSGSEYGVCCATACDGDCVSCRNASGVCTPVVAGTSCGEPFCPAETLAAELQCSVAGQCSPVTTMCGNGEVCEAGACVDEGGTSTSTTTTGSGVGGGGDGGAPTTSTTTGIGGSGGAGGAGGSTSTSTTGIGGGDGVGGGFNTSSSSGQSLDCIEEADCDAIDPACTCSLGTCLCPQLPGGGGP